MTHSKPAQAVGHATSNKGGTAAKPLTHYAWLSLLRAYGVILVLGYHFFPWLMPGGFIGVDVFFVFSGYLITSLLVKEFRKNGKVALISFYKRRFRRLLPALVAMLLVILPLTLTISADFRADIARQVAAVLSWTTNFYEIAGGGSYANALLPHLFVHTWTLSIEMQFYLIWGLALTILLPLFLTTTSSGHTSMARSRKIIAALAALLALVSFIVMQVMLIGAEDPSAAYYSTFSHAYPILIGSVIGALAGFGRSRLVVFFERLAPVLGIALTALALLVILALALFVPFENRFVYHGGLLITSLAVGLVILIGRGAQSSLHVRKEPRILQYLADRSYSIYLYHWPIMIIVLEWAKALFGKVEVGADPVYIVAALIALVLTFAISHLSYRFVEQPFSCKKKSAPPVTQAQDETRSPEATRATRLGRLPSLEAKESTTAEIRTERTSHDTPTDPKSAAKQAAMRFDSSSQKTKIAVGAVAVILAICTISVFTTAPSKTSIETDYQVGLLEIDLHKMENSHQILVNTGLGGSSVSGAPGLLVQPGTITVIGDSVTIYPAEQITALTGAFVDAEVSRAMVNGIRIVEEMQASKLLGESVVIALATNAHADSFESAIAICELLEPGHRLIFVTSYGGGGMNELSAALRTLPDSYPFVTIADWNAAIAGKDNLLAADGYHLGGQEAIDIYVGVVTQALEEAKHTPTS